MSWTSSDRRSRLPADWKKRREFVAARAGYICEATNADNQRCTEQGSECDHIKPGDNHDVNNLQWLCSWHHARKTQREAQQARREMRERRKPPKKKHPGLIDKD